MRSKAQHGGTAQCAADADGDQGRVSLAPDDLMQRAELKLRRERIQRTVMTGAFAMILGVGIVALLTNPSNRFPLIAIAVVVLGGINCAIGAGGLWRVIGEQRMHEGERRAIASRPPSDRGFDQTNGVVDLGRGTEQADPNDELDQARRLSSLNAAGIAYGNGTR